MCTEALLRIVGTLVLETHTQFTDKDLEEKLNPN